MRAARGERGSAAVVLAAGLVVALVLAMGIADLGRVLVARSRARTAADAAALAAAQELAVPSGLDPSSLAGEYATANGASLVSCDCEPASSEAVVETSVQAGELWFVTGVVVVTQRSRAIVELPA